MDKLNQDQTIIQDLLLEHPKTKPAYGDIEVDVSFSRQSLTRVILLAYLKS